MNRSGFILCTLLSIVVFGCDQLNEDEVTNDIFPSVSSDAMQIAYYHTVSNGLEKDPPTGIYIYSTETKQKSFLLDIFLLDGGVMWSPDGRQLLTKEGIISLNSEGNVLLRSSKSLGVDMSYPCWAVDGKSIVFSSDSSIYVCDTLLTEYRKLPVKGFCPRWLPDGKTILYSRPSAKQWLSEIYLTDTTTYKEIKLTDNGKKNVYATCSPDGKKIVWSCQEQIYVMDRNGTNQRFLDEGTTPAWYPDSKSVVYSKGEGSGWISFFLWKVSIDTGAKERLTR